MAARGSFLSKKRSASLFGIQEEESAPPLTSDDVISGRFFIKQLMLSDPFFGLLAEDYIDAVNSDVSAQQCVANWNIISVCLGDKGFLLPEEVQFAIMSGDAAATASLTNDIHALREFGVNSKGKSWAVLIVGASKEVPLNQRLNPFVASREAGRAPTVIFVHDAERLEKARSHVMAALKDLESKIQRAKDKQLAEKMALEAAARQRELDEQMSRLNDQKFSMLKMLEELEARFVADEKKIQQITKDAGIAVERGDAVAPVVLAKRIRDESSMPFASPPKR